MLLWFLPLNMVQAQEWQDFHITQYNSTNGLPQNSVKSMVLDSERFLWMATETGLVRFDGHDFDLFTTKNVKGLSNDRMFRIYTTVNGEFYADDIYGNIIKFSQKEVKAVYKVQKAGLGGYWLKGGVPNLNFLVSSDKESIAGVNKSDLTKSILVMPVDSDRYLMLFHNWIGVYSKKSNSISKRLQTPGFVPESGFMQDGSIFFFDEAGNCMQLDRNNLQLMKVPTSGFAGKSINRENILWNYFHNQAFLKDGSKLYRISQKTNGNGVELIPITDQLPKSVIVTEVIYDEKSGSLFVATTTKGLFIFRKKSMKTFLIADSNNVHANCFYAQFEIDSNNVYGGWDYEFSKDGPKPSRHKLGLQLSLFYFCHKNNENQVIYPLNSVLISHDLNSYEKTIIDTSKQTYHAFYQEADSLWVASDFGLSYIKNQKSQFAAPLNLKGFSQRITTINRVEKDNLWIGHCEGITKYNSKTNSISYISEMKGKCVRVIEKIKNVFLIGTYGQGWYVYADNKFHQMPIDIHHILEKVHSFMLDDNGFLWMSTNTGMVNVSFEDVTSYIKDKSKTPYYYSYDTQDGIVNTEFNGGCTPTHIRLKNGYVSYPTMEGLVWFKPEDVLRDVPNEKFFIDRVLIDGEEVVFADALTISNQSDEVQIFFSIPYWGLKENLQVEYRIKGYINEWRITEGKGRWIDFANIPHGKYTLEFRNKISGSPKEAIQLSIPLIVKPAFYETTYFLIGSVIAGALVLFSLMKLNSVRILKRNEMLENQVNERTREIQNTNSTLNNTIRNLREKEYKLRESIRIKDKLISIISHDIITPIKFLSIVSKMSSKTSNENPEGVNESLDNMKYIGAAAEKIYNNAANILNWMKLQNELITVHPENIGLCDFVDEVLEPFVDVIDQKSIELVNNIPEEDIIVSDTNILKIILQNLISNATKHTKTGTIEISSSLDANEVTTIQVKDTGIGIPEKILTKINAIKQQTVAGEFDADDPDTGNQLGYFIIFDFARLIGGSVEINSEVGKGTVVKVFLPPTTTTEKSAELRK